MLFHVLWYRRIHRCLAHEIAHRHAIAGRCLLDLPVGVDRNPDGDRMPLASRPGSAHDPSFRLTAPSALAAPAPTTPVAVTSSPPPPDANALRVSRADWTCCWPLERKP